MPIVFQTKTYNGSPEKPLLNLIKKKERKKKNKKSVILSIYFHEIFFIFKKGGKGDRLRSGS